MRLYLTILLALANFTILSAQTEVINLNRNWLFSNTDTGNEANVSYDDSKWQTVHVPHDFQISQPWVAPDANETADNNDQAANIKSRLSARGFKEMSTGWYRKKLDLRPEWRARRIVVDFEGIMLVGDVYLNGERIGGTEYGYVGFEIDITKKINWEGNNILAVRASTMNSNNSRWYTGGGLYRDVKLKVMNPQRYFDRHAIHINTLSAEKEEAEIQLNARIANFEKRQLPLTVQTIIKDPQGNILLDSLVTLNTNTGMKISEMPVVDFKVKNPMRWSCETPYLYQVDLTLNDPKGVPVDHITDVFGIRKIEYDPAFGFKLNDEKVILKGIANHHTLGALGAAAFPRAIEKRLEILKSFGVNHIRTSHNPYSESLLEMCDRMGILVVDELYDKWTTQYAGGRTEWMNIWQSDVPEFIQRDRNHPCVIMWSMGNELQLYNNLPFEDWGVTPYRLLRELVHRYDTERPVTVAMHPRGRNRFTDSIPCDLALVTDIQAYNYRYMYFPGDRDKYPYMNFYQSEASVAAMGPNYFDMELDKVIGLAYWGLIDYLGESNGWPAKGWTNGVFYIDLEPKQQAYLLKSIFTDEPMVHISVVEKDNFTMWNGVQVGTSEMSDNWNRAQGSKAEIVVYSNTDWVELFLNGKSLGKQTNNIVDSKCRNRFQWKHVPYEAGQLMAVAHKGNQIVTDKIETTGKTTKLTLVQDKTDWRADGEDLMHVRVMATDKKGRIVKSEKSNIHFTVEGDAEIIGVVNGDMYSDELHQSSERKLFNGVCTVILRAGIQGGKVVLSAVSENGMKSKLQLNVKP